MPKQPLQILSLLTLAGLIVCQLSLFQHGVSPFWIALLTAPLLIPLPGLWLNKLYTFKWVGFLTLLYFCIGVSEAVMNPEWPWYGKVTTLLSMLLFVGAIWQVRILRAQRLNNAT